MRDKRTNEQTLKIELLSQWKLEAEFRNRHIQFVFSPLLGLFFAMQCIGKAVLRSLIWSNCLLGPSWTGTLKKAGRFKGNLAEPIFLYSTIARCVVSRPMKKKEKWYQLIYCNVQIVPLGQTEQVDLLVINSYSNSLEDA